MHIIPKVMIMFVLLCSENIYLLTSGVAADEQLSIMCKDQEREALLTLKQGLTNTTMDAGTNISSWESQKDNKECCNWDGVSCSNMTNHVLGLELSGLRGEISSALLELRHLHSLVLRYNDFGGNQIPEFIGSLENLEYLDLFDSNFSSDVPYELGYLTNLKELDLSWNDLTSKDLSWLSNLTLLSSLDLSLNQFGGPLSWLSNLTLLSRIDLSNNQFDGPLPWMSNLKSLSSLDLTNNGFGGQLSSLSNLTLLSSLHLSLNQFEGPFPDLKAFSSLTRIYLGSNKLTGRLPTSISQFSNLEDLHVSYNFLEGTISDVHFSKLYNLASLDLSFNLLALKFTHNWIPPFQLDRIRLAGCNIGPGFPAWLQTQTDFYQLDLSYAGISDEVPSWFWNHSVIHFLNLSHNSMSGLIPYFSPNIQFVGEHPIPTIDISFNNFSGPLPLFDRNSFILDLSHNMFSGTIQSMCTGNYGYLQLLDLSYNQLSGDLFKCSENMINLVVLNLAENKFDGHIPPSLGSLVNLQTLILRENNFAGELPSELSGCELLQLIDCGENELTGHVPTWIGSLTNLVYLILGQNNFYGLIPPEICRLSLIQVLDLSENNISGRIPQCFQNFTSLIQNNGSIDVANVFLSFYSQVPSSENSVYVNNAIVRWKRQVSAYKSTLRFLKLIDISSNNLVGNIPLEISHLSGLSSLNLSHNHLSGNINSEIGQMKMLECLDLSRNNLSGAIPLGLAELNYLSILDLSSNNLSGKIPTSTQLQTFNASDYASNKELCGPPLPNCPGDDPMLPPAATLGNPENIDDQNYEGFNLIQSLLEGYFISVVLGFIVGFWVIVGPLLVKTSWRNAYFGYLSKIGDWLYVMITLSWTRLMRFMKSRK